MSRVGKKLGDTLIEVTIAVGVFSLVAVAVVSVVSSSTSGAQASLETTVAREEIDTQAEALRFIQNAYLNESEDSNYAEIWKQITKNLTEVNDSFMPSSCSAIYDNPNESELKNAFVINYRKLNTGDVEDIVIRQADNPGLFTLAQSSPRLTFNTSNSLMEDNAFTNKNLLRAEGIYVIVAKDNNSTAIAEGDTILSGSAYYDFYIRTCWYAAANATPSTISTVIRLYDPDIDEERDPTRGTTSEWGITFHNAVPTILCDEEQVIETTKDQNVWADSGVQITAGSSGKLVKNKDLAPEFSVGGYQFDGWCTVRPSKDDADNCKGTKYEDGATVSLDPSLVSGKLELFALWKKYPAYTIKYHANNGTTASTSSPYDGGCKIKIKSKPNSFKKSGHDFVNWCTIASTDATCIGTTYKPKDEFTTPTTGGTLHLYATWKPRYYTIVYDGNGSTGGSTETQKNILGRENIYF